MESIAFLAHAVAAVKLWISTDFEALVDSKVTTDIARVHDVVAGVLALIYDLLVTLSVATKTEIKYFIGVEYLADDQGRGGYCEDESQDSNKVLGKHCGIKKNSCYERYCESIVKMMKMRDKADGGEKYQAL